MELKDFVITPIILILVYALTLTVRPHVTDQNTRQYFIPALTLKFIGALAVGFIYQFYYGGGDTFAFHTHGSRIIWEAFMDDPTKGLKLFFANGEMSGDIFEYASKIWYFRDTQTYVIIQVSFLLDLLTFSTYSATAVLFATLSFSGMWALYLTFYEQYKHLHLKLALTILFVPSVFFWGSGILKDSVTMGCLGWMTYSFYKIVVKKRMDVRLILSFVISAFIVFSLKKYILLSFLPALLIWFSVRNFNKIRSLVTRIMTAPLIIFLCAVLGYLIIDAVGQNDSRYAFSNLAKTAQITAYDIRYGWGARLGDGSGYTLGELDGTFSSMLRLAPNAINVSLFRPYIWEVQNPLMLLSALESMVCLLLTLLVIYRIGAKSLFYGLKESEILFCFVFALVFAFAVGISTYNFGTLARYKIPLLPYYLTGLILIYDYGYLKRLRKLEVLELTE